ncbi:MAG: hypothetical protein U1F26_16720 [Lysobacterales bacterium]
MSLRFPLIAAVIASVAVPAPACSPYPMSPRDAARLPGYETPFTRIVLAEVLASRAPARLAELEQWRADVLKAAAERQRQAALDAESARMEAATPHDPRRPLPPPAEGPFPEPLLPRAIDLALEVDLFVLETIHGPHQDRLTVPAGGQCGSQPRPGQQVLVFIRSNGQAQLLMDARDGGAQTFDAEFLKDLRACVRGECPSAQR